MLGSYCGRILRVDLTTGKIETKELDAEIAKKFIGDFGIGLTLAYDLIERGIAPLSPDNAIIISVGPLVGTPFNAQRWSIVTKYPLTGAIAFGNTGMSLGRRLKRAGYDHLVITGRANQPVYLKVFNDDVQICDAKHLWGKDLFQTTDELWEELGKIYGIVTMGQAGENLVSGALTLCDRISHIGMGGLGAVMGSKNLKAIAVRGSKVVMVAKPERYEAITVPLQRAWRGDPERRTKIELGKIQALEKQYKEGVPYKNWSELYPAEDATERYGFEEYSKVTGRSRGRSVVEAPCSYTCPVGLDVPRHLRFIAYDKPAEAVAVFREKNPFPGVCGYVCTHPCETECERGMLDEPISIRALHRFAAEHDTGLWKLNSKVAPPTGRRVAIVGSGPAGLTAAYYLAKLGHSVTVFEALPEPGGMMRFGIPDYRLPKDVLRADIEEIKTMGVDIRTKIKVDSPESLFTQDYDAVFLAIGAQQGIRIGVEGDDNPKVKDCISFLKDVNLGKEVKLGGRVAVIGGGSAAVDSAASALRLGAEEVTILYRRTRAEMLASAEAIDAAIAEGVKVHFLAAPSKIMSRDGELQFECIGTQLGAPDASGRRRPVPIKGSEFSIDVDTIIAAVGQCVEVPKQFGLLTTPENTVQADRDTLGTNREGIFAGGDAVTGPASIIEAIAAGRKAAISIDKYLGGSGAIGETLAPPEPVPGGGSRISDGKLAAPKDLPPFEESKQTQRPQVPTLPVGQRLGFAVIELGFSKEMAIEEAKRCLRCDLKVGCPGCPYPCKDVLEVKEGEYKGLTTNVSSVVGRTWTLGIRSNAGTWPRLVKLIDLCNRYGVDTHGLGPTIDLAIEMYERGIITGKDTRGLVLRRDFETTVKLLEQITFRKGIGNILADGSLALIKKFGPEAERHSCTIKGIDATNDARVTHLNMPSFNAIICPEGGFHATGNTMKLRPGDPDYSQELVKSYCRDIGVPKEAMSRILYEPEGYNVARLCRYENDFYCMMTCLGICNARAYSFDVGKLAELYSAATGIEMSVNEMKEAGNRVWNLFKAINVREGFSRKDDRIPLRWFQPLKTASGEEIFLKDINGRTLSRDDMERLVSDYYEESSWEVERGIPSKEKLMELGLANLVADFQKLGILK